MLYRIRAKRLHRILEDLYKRDNHETVHPPISAYGAKEKMLTTYPQSCINHNCLYAILVLYVVVNSLKRRGRSVPSTFFENELTDFATLRYQQLFWIESSSIWRHNHLTDYQVYLPRPAGSSPGNNRDIN